MLYINFLVFIALLELFNNIMVKLKHMKTITKSTLLQLSTKIVEIIGNVGKSYGIEGIKVAGYKERANEETFNPEYIKLSAGNNLIMLHYAPISSIN